DVPDDVRLEQRAMFVVDRPLGGDEVDGAQRLEGLGRAGEIGQASSTVAPSSENRRAAATQIARVAGSTGEIPRSAEKATRRGASRAAAAARKLSAGAGSEIGSSTCQPTMASSISPASSTLRAIGPLTDSVPKRRSRGPLATRPGLGLSPT